MAARATQLPCFLAGTLVSTPEGLRRIEEILSGDRVWGYDLRRGEWRGCVVSYHASVAYDDLVVTVRAGGSEVKSTYHHPYWVVSGEDLDQRPTPDQLGEQLQSVPGVEGRWVDAGDLRVGDVLLSRTGGQSTVESVEAEHTPTTVYHLYVEDVHNYAVGDQEWLVHNAHTGRVDDVVQDHHAIPWSNKTYKHQKHPLVKLAGNPKLKTMPENLKPVQGHAGRHSTSYHDEINDRMDVAYEKVMKVKDAAKRGPAAKRQLNKVIQDIWADIGDETLPLYDHKDVILP